MGKRVAAVIAVLALAAAACTKKAVSTGPPASPPASVQASATQTAIPTPVISASGAVSGGIPSPTPPPAPTPKPSPAPGQTQTTFGVADSGKTVQVARGASIRIYLEGSTGFPWTQPASSNAAVLAPVPGQPPSPPPPGSADVTFAARAAGTAQITATQDALCRHSVPACMVASRLFTLTVNVTG